MAEKTINFSHDYPKLSWDRFTTIRGVTYAARHRFDEGDVVDITVKRRFRFKALVEYILRMPIGEIPLETLWDDVNDITINHNEFCEKLGKIWRYRKPTPSTVVSVIMLRKVDG